MSEYAVVILAAGNSSRMGAPKQLLEYCGQSLLRHAARTALDSLCGHVIVVLGSQSDKLRPLLQGLPVTIVVNERWKEGMGTSILAGVQAARKAGVDGLILALADQPLITPAVFDRLVSGHVESGLPIVASRYAGTVGVPVFFSHEYFPILERLKPAEGCKPVIMRSITSARLLDCPEAEIDVDTPEDYIALNPDRATGRASGPTAH